MVEEVLEGVVMHCEEMDDGERGRTFLTVSLSDSNSVKVMSASIKGKRRVPPWSRVSLARTTDGYEISNLVPSQSVISYSDDSSEVW